MQVEFLSKFSKDIDTINQKNVRANLFRLIQLLESADNLNTIPNLKKLAGHKSAYRIRLGDYRVGFFMKITKLFWQEVILRKDIYKLFP